MRRTAAAKIVVNVGYAFGEHIPERDYWSLYTQDGEQVAYFVPWTEHLLFVKAWGNHPPQMRWSYDAPAGYRQAHGDV